MSEYNHTLTTHVEQDNSAALMAGALGCRYRQMLRLADRKTFIVVPAFEAATLPVAAAAVGSKARARMSLDGGQLFQFARHFERGHAPTNYTR